MNIIKTNSLEQNQIHYQTIQPYNRSQSEERKENDLQILRKSIRIQRKYQSRIVNKKSADILIKLFQKYLKETTQTILNEQNLSQGDISRLRFLIKQKKLRLSCLVKQLRNSLINQLAELFFGDLKWIRLSLSQNYQSNHSTRNLLTTSGFILEKVLEIKNQILIDV